MYIKIIEKEMLYHERPFEISEETISECYRFRQDSPVPYAYKLFRNNEEYLKAYKEAGGTVYLNRDRYNEIVEEIVEQLKKYRVPGRPYSKESCKKLNQDTQQIIDEELASILVIDENDNIIFACDIDTSPYFYLTSARVDGTLWYEETVWYKFWCRKGILRKLTTFNKILILGDGTLYYYNSRRPPTENIYYGDLKWWFNQVFNNMREPASWNNLLGEMDLFLRDDRYPNAELSKHLIFCHGENYYGLNAECFYPKDVLERQKYK